MSRRWRAWSLAVAALAMTAACGGGEPLAGAALAPGDARPVSPPAATVDGFVGVVTSRHTSVVACEVDARVEEIYVHMGDRVAAGDPIARLDDVTMRQRLAAARAAADGARAAAARARLEVADARHRQGLAARLFRQGISAREEVRTAEFAVGKARTGARQADAATRQADAEVAELERLVAATTLTAPSAGVVTSLRLRPGERLNAGAAVARIVDPDQLWVRFAVPADRLAEVHAGQAIALTTDDAGLEIRGVVRNLSPELEPPLRLVVVEAEVVDDVARRALPLASGIIGRVQVAGPPG